MIQKMLSPEAHAFWMFMGATIIILTAFLGFIWISERGLDK